MFAGDQKRSMRLKNTTRDNIQRKPKRGTKEATNKNITKGKRKLEMNFNEQKTERSTQSGETQVLSKRKEPMRPSRQLKIAYK